MPRSRETVLVTGAALASVVLWASAFVAIRHVGRDLSPGVIALGRLLAGSVALSLVVLVRSARRPGTSQGDWPRGIGWLWLAICGMCWFGVYNIALNAAEQRIDAGTASVLVKLGPIMVTVLAGVLLREGLPARLLLGSVVALAGVVIIGVSVSPTRVAGLSGVALCVLAAVGYAIGVVAERPVLSSVSALRVTWLACLVGAVTCLPFAAEAYGELRSASWSTIGWVIYLGLLPTAVGFTTWAYALARSSAGRLAAITYLVPPVAILLGWLLLRETPALLALAGGALCLAGVYVTQRPRRRRLAKPRPW